MSFREAGERFRSVLEQLKERKDLYVRSDQDQTGTGVSYEITPSRIMLPERWESLCYNLGEEAKRIAREVNEERQLSSDKAVFARAVGYPVSRYEDPVVAFDLRAGPKKQTTMNPITISFSIPYFPRIR